MNAFFKLFSIYVRKEKWLMIGLIVFLIQLSVFFVFHKSVYSYSDYSSLYSQAGLEFFYYVHSIGLHPYLFICLLLLLPNLLAADFLHHEKQHVHYMIESRITKKRYYWYSVIQNMLLTFLCTLMIEIMLVITIHLFYLPIAFHTTTYPQFYYVTTQLLCSNEVINLILFIIYTSLGYSVVSALFFSLQRVINNLYVYRCFGVMGGIMLVLLPALLQGYFPHPDIPFLLQINHLVCNGVEGLRENPFQMSCQMLFLTTFSLYGLISLFLSQMYEKWRKTYD